MKFSHIVLLAFLAPTFALAAEKGARADQSVGANSTTSAANSPAQQTASLDAYATHLESLLPLVSACTAARNSAACDPSKVGSDDEIVLPTGEHRMIRFGWLRALLEKAQKPDEPQP